MSQRRRSAAARRDRKDIVPRGVGEEAHQVGHRPVARRPGLRTDADEGDHGHPPPQHLTQLVLNKGVGVVGQAKGVKDGAARVVGVARQKDAHGLERLDSAVARVLGAAHEHQLRERDGQHARAARHAQPLDAKVIERATRKLGGAHAVPHGVLAAQVDAEQPLQRLGCGRAGHRQHRPARVQQLQLVQPLKVALARLVAARVEG
mmetsp:Transcript_7454/g.22650  ORF Transcript_7454/g.22650 Transcript_7454/m.22650 type:complete len:205 (-) Transcript_7454:130-744(-)